MANDKQEEFSDIHIEFESNGKRLSGFLSMPKTQAKLPVPGVILCHGLTNNKIQCPLITETANELLNLGFAVFRFDFFGSGESAGELRDKTISEMSLNLRDAIEFFKRDPRVNKNFIGLWGRSLGGTIVLLHALDEGIRAIVAISTTILLQNDFNYVFDNYPDNEYIPMPEKMRPSRHGYVQKGPWELHRRYFLELYEIENKLKEILKKSSNICIMHGSKDEKVAIVNAQTIYDLVNEPKEIHIIEGVKGHQYYNGHGREFIEIGLNWLTKLMKR